MAMIRPEFCSVCGTWKCEVHEHDIDAARKRFLGEAFLQFYPSDLGGLGLMPLIEINPKIIAAACLGIEYGDPGPKLPVERCRQCWGDRYIWLGNTWGLRHMDETMYDCKCDCHKDEVWMAGINLLQTPLHPLPDLPSSGE